MSENIDKKLPEYLQLTDVTIKNNNTCSWPFHIQVAIYLNIETNENIGNKWVKEKRIIENDSKGKNTGTSTRKLDFFPT